MTSKIFKSTLSVAIAVLVASIAIIVGVLYPYFGRIQQSQLVDELEIAADAVEELGTEYLDKLDSDQYRLTWVDTDGTVLYDNQADASSMENHADREEIKEAFSKGSGSSVRQSPTLTEQTIYEALRLEDGTVLRISVSRATLVLLVLGMMQPMCVVLALAIAISAWLSHRMARRVVEPLNKLDLDHPLENNTYEELSPLLHRIHAQRREISRQVKTLRDKQEEFDQITGNMKEALVLLDNKGIVISINPAARKLFGLTGSSLGDDILKIDRKQDMRLALENTMKQGHASFKDEREGKIYQFDLNRIDSDGDVHGMVILAFDVTEEARAEQNRQEFTANVSHELKTPLQSIIGSAELMENGIVKEEDIPRFVERIRKEATRLVNLIDDIIRLSQLDEAQEMPREEVSLMELAEEATESLSDAAKMKNVEVKVFGDNCVIKGVRRLLYEVIYNLCDNAIKYNKDGGYVKLSIEGRQKGVLLSVADNGIGIAAGDQEKIFERFYRVDKSHSRQSGGTGLGLSIVKHAVQYHHANLSIESELGKGTTISILFDK